MKTGMYWYCHICQKEVPAEQVTHNETHDPRHGGCGSIVALKPPMTTPNQNGSLPVFPCIKPNENLEGFDSPHLREQIFMGLTKRELFAAMALQGLIACPHHLRFSNNNHDTRNVGYSAMAVELADALLAELEKPQ